MTFSVTLDLDEDGWWVVRCPAIPGCISQGRTRDEALSNIRDAIELCLEVRAELGMPLALETAQVDVDCCTNPGNSLRSADHLKSHI